MQRSFSIQFVSKVTGINAHTIRAWEKRYQAVVPERSDNGKRIYSQAEVDRLSKLNELVKLGNAISDVAKLSELELGRLYSEYVSLEKTPVGQHLTLENIDIHTTLQNIIMALKSYKLDIISYELEKLKANLNSRDLALSIIVPLLEEVEREVKGGVLNVGQEHGLSSVLKFHIGQTLFSSIKENAHESTIIFATPEGELNEFGIMISALLASFYNYKFLYLGPNIPADSLAQACKEVKAKRLILGVTSKYNQSYNKRLDEYLMKLLSKVDNSLDEIIVEGNTGAPLINNYGKTIEVIPTLQMLDQNLSIKTKKIA
jgi:DNA-binding transcriptional MerR regulator